MSDKIVDFRCTPERLVFNSDEYKIYGCSVNSFEYPDIQIGKYGTATIKGNVQELNLGVEYTVKAKEISDKYGVGYEVINIKREKPTTLAATRNFLYEILTPNQTDTLLEAYPDIVDRIMNNRLDDIDLSKTKRIKEYTFNVIKQKVIENFKLADLVEEFRGLFSLSIIKKLYDKYPSVEKIKEVIRTEPYECLCRLSGIGFKTADGMLLTLEKESKQCKETSKNPILFFGFDLKPSYQRAKACVDYILNENETNGNTYVKVGELKKQFEILVPEAIANLPLILKGDNDVIFDRESLSVCKKETYETEKYIAEKIKEGLSINTEWDCDCSKFRSLEGFDLTEDQCKTSEYMCKHNIIMLVGYGGAGKSSSTQAFVNLLKHYNKSFMLLAPTGRAAKVLSGFTGENAMTIHRGLGYMPPNEWCYNKDNPIPHDVVIVDEFSMVDIFLFKHLLEGIDFNKTKLLLIGDDAQIPSVGAGNVLYDLLCYENIPTITLDKIFRYGKGGLSTVATDTRTGTEYLDKTKSGMQVFGEDSSYIFMSMAQDKVVDYTVKLYQKVLSQGYKIEDIAVLSCYNVGEYGTVELNKRLQNAVNSNPKEKITFGDSEFRLNDIVMNFTNDYKAILYNEEYLDDKNTTFIANGESGRIVKILPNAMVIDYDGTLIYCPKSSMKNIRLAYAMSVHKCITKDTMIFTENGICELSELDNNALVGETKEFSTPTLIYNGTELEISKGFYNAGLSECKKIITERGYDITGTLDHKIDVIDEDGFIVQKTFDELSTDDYVLINTRNNIFSDKNVMPSINMDYMIYLDTRTKTYKVPLKMTNEFAMFLGMIVADGCIYNNTKITHGKNQKEVSDKFIELAQKLFGYNAENKNVIPNGIMGGMFLTEINSRFIAEYLNQIDGLRVNNKFVPECILKSTEEIQCSFLKGLFEDGSVNLKGNNFDHIEFCTHSMRMHKQLQMMLLNLGIITSTSYRHNNYYIYIYKRHAKIFLDKIGFISFDKQEKLIKCTNNPKKYSTNYRIPNVIRRIRNEIKSNDNNNINKSLTTREKEILRRNDNLVSEKFLLQIMKKYNFSESLVNDITYILENVYVDKVKGITDTVEECFCLEMPISHKFIQNGFIGSNCQGSQYRVVILITPKAHTFMLNSNLLYVGESRAKEKCYHLGEVRTVNNALKKKENFDRKTLLLGFLQAS